MVADTQRPEPRVPIVVVQLSQKDNSSHIPDRYLRREPLEAVIHGTYQVFSEDSVEPTASHAASLQIARTSSAYAVNVSLDLSVFRPAYKARIRTVDEEEAWLRYAGARARVEHQEYPLLLCSLAADLYWGFLPRRQAGPLARRLSRSAEALFAPAGPWHDAPRRFTDYVLRASMTLGPPNERPFIQLLERLLPSLGILHPTSLELRYRFSDQQKPNDPPSPHS